MNEAKTRAEHIAPALRAAGWGVVASISDAVADLDPPAEIGRAFSDFQKHLHAEASK